MSVSRVDTMNLLVLQANFNTILTTRVFNDIYISTHNFLKIVEIWDTVILGSLCRNSNKASSEKFRRQCQLSSDWRIDGLAATPQGGSKEIYDVMAARYRNLKGCVRCFR